MPRTYRTVRGMRDFLPEDLAKRRFVETRVRECFKLYGYGEVETPIIESFELISAKAGDEIRHRMYTFEDFGGRRLALRPEITPSIARVVSNRYRTAAKPLRLGYIANCFRYDNPQMGRYREFWQAGFELFGSTQSTADAEILIVNNDLMKRAGFNHNHFYFKIGQVAILRAILTEEDITEDQQNTIMGLMDRGEQKEVFSLLRKFNASPRCQELMSNLYDLKGSDSQEILAKGKQLLHDHSDALTALHNLEEIIHYARVGGVETRFLVDLSFARGLEYYTGMIFEVYVNGLDIALGGGGRYDRLVEIFGGGSIPGVGCAPGIDRIALALEKLNLYPKDLPLQKILVIPVNPRNSRLTETAFKIAAILRESNIIAQNEVAGRNLRSALSYASKQGFSHLVIIGQKELDRKCVIIRDLQAAKQWEIPLSELPHALQ